MAHGRRRFALKIGLASAWQFGRIGLQLAWLILLARALGPLEYGTFAGTAALATALSTVTGLGFGLLMLQRVSQDASVFGPSWQRALQASLVSGALMLAAFAILVPLALPGSLGSVALAAIALAELVCFPLVVLSSHAFQAHERIGFANAVMLLIPIGNLAAAGLFLIAGGGLSDYVGWHALGAVAAAATALAMVWSKLNPGATGITARPLSLADVRAGAGLSTMRVVDTTLASVDKTLVLQLAGAEAAGLYTAAYRLAAALAVPVGALAMVVLPGLYRLNPASTEARTRSVRLLVASVALGGAASIGMWFLADLLPVLLGREFSGVVETARRMALVPLLLGLCAMACTILLAQGRVLARTLAQAAGVGAMLAISAVLVKNDPSAGPAMMLQITLAITAALLWFLVWKQVHSNAFPPISTASNGQNPDSP